MNKNLYIYKTGNNFGDTIGYYILKKYFPKVKFDATSNDYLFFGGSTFHHHKSLGKMNSIVYFGNGLASFYEIDLPKCNNIQIYPRGESTKNMLERVGYKCNKPIGDVVQFIALEPIIKEVPKYSELWIKDAFNDIPIPKDAHCVAVCESPLTAGYEVMYDLKQFRYKIKDYEKVISSQIHPFLIALMLGKSAQLIYKDIRALDICNFFDIPFNCSKEDAMKVRAISQKNTVAIKYLFNKITKE